MEDIKNIIKNMTLEEKASLMSGKDFWQTKDIPKHNIDSIFLADGPHGIRKQAKSADHLGLNESLKATCFPTAATMANSWNTELGQEMAEYLGIEAAYQKVNVLLGPGLNIKRNPLCGRNFEYFSEDPYLAGKMAGAYVKGIQKSGVSACLKHFAANNQEERRMVIDTIVDERTYREIYLTGFEIAIKESKPKTVMSAYNKINGYYANESKHLLQEILRDEWRYEGVVVTDWGGNNDRVDALKCGNELEMPTTDSETNQDIVNAVNAGKLDVKYLDDAVERLLKLIFDTQKALSKEQNFSPSSHHTMAQRAAEDSIVLLKNNRNLLPIRSCTKVAAIGDFAQKPRFQGAGSSIVNPSKVDDFLTSITRFEEFDFVGFEKGFERFGKKKKSLIKKAVKLAQKADTLLVFLGLDEATETEGLDRKNMRLPQNQIDLIKELKKVNKPIVAILSCGAAIELDIADDCDAVVHGYLLGQAGAKAILNVITGRVNPSGKLAESYPYKYDDCSSAPYFPGGKAISEYRESIYVGYRYYDTTDTEVRYPFGYGLSYTQFKYSDLKVDKNGVEFIVTNIGDYAGAEVCQLYIGADNSKIFRAKKELKGFKKVYLEEKESKKVRLDFDDYSFRYFNVFKNAWDIEACTYNIYIGSSSKDIKLESQHVIQGEELKEIYDKGALSSYYNAKIKNISNQEFSKLIDKPLANTDLTFIKRKRILITTNTAIQDLRYSRGWVGRFFTGALKFGYNFLRFIGKKDLANVMMMGLFNMPIRGLSRMAGGMISWGQLNGLITMFNGKFFKGLRIFLKQGRIKKKRRKAEAKVLKNKKAARA